MREDSTGSGTAGIPSPKILVLSPTRELAQQIAEEVRTSYCQLCIYLILASPNLLYSVKTVTDFSVIPQAKTLCKFHNDIGVVLFVGGTNMNSDVRAINRPTGNNSGLIPIDHQKSNGYLLLPLYLTNTVSLLILSCGIDRQ